MKRQWLVILAVIAAAGVAIALLRVRGPRPGGETGATLQDNAFVDDSVGVALRLPESPGWSLRRDTGAKDGRLVTATHESGLATVRLYSQRVPPSEDLEGIFARRQEEIASAFGVKELDQVVAHVMRDSVQEIGGKKFRQWQALTRDIEVPGEKPSRILFSWLLTKQPERSIECIGMVRIPAQPTEEDKAKADVLLGDVSYVLQSIQVR